MTNPAYNPSLIRHCPAWCFLLPQALLIGSNLYGWLLVAGDATSSNSTNALFIFSYQVGLCVFFTVLWLQLLRNKLEPSVPIALISLCLQISYLFAFMLLIGDTIPDKTQRWILREGNVGRWNFTLLMPGLFLSLYALTKGMFSEAPTNKSIKISLATALAGPALWYILVAINQPLWGGQFTTVIWIIVGTMIALAFLGALIKLVDSLTQTSLKQQSGYRHYIYTALFALILPLCGLYLNRIIDFPANLQLAEIYALTLINAAVLAIKPNNNRFLKTTVFLRFTTLPFIAYIFLLFLPFLPLSLFAILAVGAGFLMLSPLLLGVYQFKVSFTDFQNLKRQAGTAPTLALALGGVLIIPGTLGVQAVLDKQALAFTLNHFYSYDPDSPPLTKQQIQRSQHALIQLKARKESSQLPYIYGLYNHIVFGQMVLSDKKIADTYRLLSNHELPETTTGFMGYEHARRSWRPRLIEPHTDITINQHKITQHPDKTTLRLTLLNNTKDTHALFHETLTLPEGVFVTGLRLKIDDTWENGKIFDKKTALWVFQKITEVRRDPALITYETPSQLSLRVYPFPAHGVREVELDFIHHPAVNPSIALGNLELPLNQPTENTVLTLTTNGEPLEEISDTTYHFQRQPYLHTILDYSVGSRLNAQQYIAHIQNISRKLSIPRVAISAANIETSSNSLTIFHIDDTQAIKQAIQSIQLTEQAGFWCQRTLAHEIQRQTEIELKDQPNRLASLYNTPVFIMLHGETHNQDNHCQYLPAAWQLPDIRYYYRYANNELSRLPFSGDHLPPEGPPLKVVALEQEEKIYLLAAKQNNLIDIKSSIPFAIFDPAKKIFLESNSADRSSYKPTEQWLAASTAWQLWKNAAIHPANLEKSRSELLELSRKAHVLLPETALIVVEHASQWEILKRKEEQALKNHSALDFNDAQDTPEPPEIILLILLVAFLAYKRRNRQRT